jgi:hypothetical protein
MTDYKLIERFTSKLDVLLILLSILSFLVFAGSVKLFFFYLTGGFLFVLMLKKSIIKSFKYVGFIELKTDMIKIHDHKNRQFLEFPLSKTENLKLRITGHDRELVSAKSFTWHDGGSNFIQFESNGQTYKYEFYIRNRDALKMLSLRFGMYEKQGIKYEVIRNAFALYMKNEKYISK